MLLQLNSCLKDGLVRPQRGAAVRLSANRASLAFPSAHRSRLHGRRTLSIKATLSRDVPTERNVLDALESQFDYASSIASLRSLKSDLSLARTDEEKVARILREPMTADFIASSLGMALYRDFRDLPPLQRFCLLALPAIGQAHVLSVLPRDRPTREALEMLAQALERCERFYDAIGGIVGYQLRCLELILADLMGADCGCDPGPASSSSSSSSAAPPQVLACEQRFHRPPGPDLASSEGAGPARSMALEGLRRIGEMAEVYPLGGAGDRLGLRDPVSGDCLPTAVLPYCGRSLLAGLIRDLQAREYLHWRVYGVQHVTPVAIMTSDAKGNHRRVMELLEGSGFFGRGAGAFRAFRQPMVPVVSAEDGRWPLPVPMAPALKPGGHGAIWKLMSDTGCFDWLLGSAARRAAVVRQISNPLAGTDTTLLALSGTGLAGQRAFGFASCERADGATEGVNVLVERRIVRRGARPADPPTTAWEYGVSNVEYTEFGRLGAQPPEGLPANTNVLYLDIARARGLVESGAAAGGGAALPGMILNMKKKMAWSDAASGRDQEARAGRLECTMQNIADYMYAESPRPLGSDEIEGLDTFVVYNRRRKVTSSAKRQRAPGSSKVHQTPDGSFHDLMENAAEILDMCGMAHPPVGTVAQYLSEGPGFLFLFHPALGPAWSVIAQKIRGGSLALGAELVLEAAECHLADTHVTGSLLVEAERVMGHTVVAAAGGDGAAVAVSSLAAGPVELELQHKLNGNGNGHGHGRHAPLEGYEGSQNGHAGSNGHGHVSNGNGNGAHVSNGRHHEHAPALSPLPLSEQQQRRREERLVFSDLGGRARFVNVRVQNAGIERCDPEANTWWRHDVRRLEACRVILKGRSEFEARDVTISGDAAFEVPDGFRMLVLPATPTPTPSSSSTSTSSPYHTVLERLDPAAPPSWWYEYAAGEEGAGVPGTAPLVRVSLRESESGAQAPRLWRKWRLPSWPESSVGTEEAEAAAAEAVWPQAPGSDCGGMSHVNSWDESSLNSGSEGEGEQPARRFPRGC